MAAEKEKVNIPVFVPTSSTKLGTRFSTSTTRRILDSASLSKADLARNRMAGSTTTVLVATKWEYRTKIAYVWLTSEKGTSSDARLVSQLSIMVTHRGESCRILLYGAGLLEGWSLQQNEQGDNWLCQLVHCILEETPEGQSILSLINLLDRVRSGWFDVICLLPAAATWSRARHFGNGQQPLRSRAEPFGLQILDTLSMSKVTASKQQLEFGSWFFFSHARR